MRRWRWGGGPPADPVFPPLQPPARSCAATPSWTSSTAFRSSPPPASSTWRTPRWSLRSRPWTRKVRPLAWRALFLPLLVCGPLSPKGGCSGQGGNVEEVRTTSKWMPGLRWQRGHGHFSTGPGGQLRACAQLGGAHGVTAVNNRGSGVWGWLPDPDCSLRMRACVCVWVWKRARLCRRPHVPSFTS